MEIIIKNINGEYKATISVKVLEPFPKILEKFNLVKEPYEANIFAINEKINATAAAQATCHSDNGKSRRPPTPWANIKNSVMRLEVRKF